MSTFIITTWLVMAALMSIAMLDLGVKKKQVFCFNNFVATILVSLFWPITLPVRILRSIF